MSSINPYASPQSEQLVLEQRPIPTTLGEVVSAGTSLYVNHFGTWVAMALVIWVPLELAGSYLEYFVIDPDDIARAFQMNALFEGVFGIIVTGGVIHQGRRAWRGEPISWTGGLLEGLAAWPRLFSTRLIGGIVLALGLVACVIPGLYVAVRIALADSVTVVEQKGGMRALPRSMELSYGKFVRYLLLTCITYGPLVLLGAFHQLPMILVPKIDHWVVSAALTLILDIAAPWVALVLLTAYFAETAEKAVVVGSEGGAVS